MTKIWYCLQDFCSKFVGNPATTIVSPLLGDTSSYYVLIDKVLLRQVPPSLRDHVWAWGVGRHAYVLDNLISLTTHNTKGRTTRTTQTMPSWLPSYATIIKAHCEANCLETPWDLSFDLLKNCWDVLRHIETSLQCCERYEQLVCRYYYTWEFLRHLWTSSYVSRQLDYSLVRCL